jgi:hypothetical protein
MVGRSPSGANSTESLEATPSDTFCFLRTIAHRPAAIHPRESAIRRAALVCPSQLQNTATRALLLARLELEMSRLLKGWMSLCVTLGLVAGGLPAEASEVVKLARLVVSGKRASTEATRTTAPEPRPAPGSQTHGSGGSDEAGTAPAPARGVS